jgi:hypothetical protein
MSIKLAVLKSGEDLISDVKEIISEDNVVGYLLHNPYVVTCQSDIFTENEENQEQINISFRPWLILSKDTQIPIRPDWLVTIVEPVDTLKNMYEEKVNGQSDQSNSTDEQSNSDQSD